MMATTNLRTTLASAVALLGLAFAGACGEAQSPTDRHAAAKGGSSKANPADADPAKNGATHSGAGKPSGVGGLGEGGPISDAGLGDPKAAGDGGASNSGTSNTGIPDSGVPDSGGGVGAQNPADEPQDPKKGAASALKDLFAQLKEQGIHLDLKTQTVALDCVMNNPVDSIEYALIHRRGKTHEALLYTFARPSLINASLLMLGFENGANVTYREADPLPTREEVDLGAEPVEVFPPRGQQIWMTVRWTDVDDKVVEMPLENLLLDLDTQTEISGAKFIFLGGTVAPMERGGEPKFFADLEGNLVSTVYRSPPNHLVTIVHDKARSDGQWWTTALCPEEGARVQLVFHAKETKLHQARIARIQAEGLRDAGGRSHPENQVPSRAGSGTHQPAEPKGGPGKKG